MYIYSGFKSRSGCKCKSQLFVHFLGPFELIDGNGDGDGIITRDEWQDRYAYPGRGKPTCSDKWKGYGKCYQMMIKGKCDETYGNCKRTCGMCGKCKDYEKEDKCKEMMEAGKCTNMKVAKICYKTCYNCGYFGGKCKDKMPSKKCKQIMKAGKCEDKKIAKKCMKTCNMCD